MNPISLGRWRTHVPPVLMLQVKISIVLSVTDESLAPDSSMTTIFVTSSSAQANSSVVCDTVRFLFEPTVLLPPSAESSPPPSAPNSCTPRGTLEGALGPTSSNHCTVMSSPSIVSTFASQS
eukprot:14630_5